MRTLRSLLVVAFLLGISAVALADTYDLLAGNPKTGIKDAGDVYVWDSGGFLYVQYVLDFAPYALNDTHIEVSDGVMYDGNGDIIPPTPEQIPQKKGNPIPGQFTYGDGAGPHAIPISWPAGTELYLAIHGKVCKDVDSIIDAIDAIDSLPYDVMMCVAESSDPDVYIEVTISGDGFLNGVYDGYCIDPGLGISQSGCPYEVEVSTDGYGPIIMKKVNYVINQDYIGQQSPGGFGEYTNSDIQGALWVLFGFDLGVQVPGGIYPDPPPDENRVAEIVEDAEANYADFELECGDYLAVKLEPLDDEVQPILIKFPIDCDCQTVWGAIVDYSVDPPYAHDFPGKNWALYVIYEVGSATGPPSPAPPRMSAPSKVTTTWGSIKNR